MLRSLTAILSGYILINVLSKLLTLTIFRSAVIGTGVALGQIAIIFACAFLGGFATAAIAQVRMRRHVTLLAALYGLMAVLSGYASTGIAPIWYSIAVVISGLAGIALGGRYRMNLRDRNEIETTPLG